MSKPKAFINIGCGNNIKGPQEIRNSNRSNKAQRKSTPYRSHLEPQELYKYTGK